MQITSSSMILSMFCIALSAFQVSGFASSHWMSARVNRYPRNFNSPAVGMLQSLHTTAKQATTVLFAAVSDKGKDGSGLRNTKTTTIPVDLGDGYQTIDIELRPLFMNSTFFSVTYDVPFGLNIEKPPKNFPAPTVTKDGKNGELKGDVLRATTSWSQGFNAAGATSDIMSFAGNIKWRKSIFDVTGAPWDQVVDALVSNTEERSKTVTLVFERELPVEDESLLTFNPDEADDKDDEDE